MEDSWIISKVLLIFFFHKINFISFEKQLTLPLFFFNRALGSALIFSKKNTIGIESVNMAYFEYLAWTNQHKSATDLSTNQRVVQPHKEILSGVQVG